MNARELRQVELEGEIELAERALRNQFNDYKEKGGNILIILGIMVSAYALYKLLTSDEEEKEVVVTKSAASDSFLGNAFWGLAGSVVLGLAKDKILDFLENKLNES